MFSRFSLIAVTLSLSFLASCKTSVEGLQVDPSFTFSSLTEQPVAVGGVTNSPSTADLQVDRLNSILETRLKHGRPEVSVVSAGTLRHSVGEAKYQSMMREFQGSGALSPQSLQALSDSRIGARYVVFARVEGNDIKKAELDEEEKDTKGKVTRYNVKTTERKVRMGFKVYELPGMTQAWSGYITKDREEQKRIEQKDHGGFWKNVAMSVLTDDSHPEPPTLESVASQIIDGFVENLPEKK